MKSKNSRLPAGVFVLHIISFRAKFFDFLLKSKEIFHCGGFLVGVSKNCRRVESSHNKASVFFNKLAVLLGDLEIRVNETNCGNSSKANDYFWVDYADLFFKPWAACRNFGFFRVAVFGRAAFYMFAI